jgi:hypothetical protein
MLTTAICRRGAALLVSSLALVLSFSTVPSPLGPPVARADTVQTLTIDRSKVFQTFTAWEGNANIAGYGEPWYAGVRDEVARRAAELGISQLRLEIRADVDDGAGHYDWTAFDQRVEDVVRPMALALLEARGETLRINVCNVAFGSGADPAHPHRDPATFGRFARAAVERAATHHGLAVEYFEICLEPDNTGGNTIFKSPARIAESVLAVRSALDAAGFPDVKIIAPSCVNMTTARNWMRTLRDVYPDAFAAVDLFSYHRYSGTALNVVTEIGNITAAGGKQSGQTEYMGGTYTHLYEDLVSGRVSTWQKYGIGGSSDDPRYVNSPLFRIDDADPSNVRVADGVHTPALRQFFAYIRPGAVRVGYTAAPNAMAATVWINPGDKIVVTLQRKGGPFDLVGLAPGSYEVSYVLNGVNVIGGVYTTSTGKLRVRAPNGVCPLTVRQL